MKIGNKKLPNWIFNTWTVLLLLLLFSWLLFVLASTTTTGLIIASCWILFEFSNWLLLRAELSVGGCGDADGVVVFGGCLDVIWQCIVVWSFIL